MKYISTRSRENEHSFRDSVMNGLAEDGGLFLPAGIPDTSKHLTKWATLPYRELAFEIMRFFSDRSTTVSRALLAKSYSAFRHEEVTPVVQMGDMYIVELFHGPTLAFKDVALQFLGNLFEQLLNQENRELNIIAATSGDTGSAAISGVRGKNGIRIFVMYPQGRISSVQELQMTSVPDKNVLNIAVKGTFDDCQKILKTILGDAAFRNRFSLGAVNSINWARILAQIVYYFYSAFRVMEKTGADLVQFAVPTGNFGDIFAGFMACRMGLPIKKLILATNENDILSRFFKTGIYRSDKVRPTPSPSMDIQVASNFERYLYYRSGENCATVKQLMESFAETGIIKVNGSGADKTDKLFSADSADTRNTLDTINRFYKKYEYLVDPHTAVGISVAERVRDANVPTICLATAHPAKFPDAIKEATGKTPPQHQILERLSGLPTRNLICENSVDAVRKIIAENIN